MAEAPQPDPDFRHVATLLAAVAERAGAEGDKLIRDWLLRLAKSDVDDLTVILAAELERALQI